MQSVIDAINKDANVEIDEYLTQPLRKEKQFTKFDDMAPQMHNFNHMCDILVLPTTEEGFNGLLVVVDLGSHMFDMEPIKFKTSDHLLKALQEIYKRGILKKPEYSMATDDGSEWKGSFNKWLYDNSIFHD